MPEIDTILETIAHYLSHPPRFSETGRRSAHLSLIDAFGCAILSLQYEACTKLLGPIVPLISCPKGSRVPGVSSKLDPITASFNWGTMIRWLDYNDTWLAKEWGHPSDNMGAILGVGDYLSQKTPIHMSQIFDTIIQAYEIQGVLALSLSCHEVGLDHVFFVKIASAAITMKLLGGSESQIIDALSQAWIDSSPLRTYRHAPNTGSRKSWAAGDATARGAYLAHLTLRGEMGYPKALTAKQWGAEDALFRGKSITLAKELDEYVIDHILYKVLHPAEFHAQTAVEAALVLHKICKDRLDDIAHIEVMTHASAIKIIDKKGPLKNPADRDHCLQYMIAVPLIYGHLTAEHYENDFAQDERIDRLRSLMTIHEEPRFSREYHEADKRSIANSLKITFKDGTSTEKVTIEYPLGHKRRREEAKPHLKSKLFHNLQVFYGDKTQEITDFLFNFDKVSKLSLDEFLTTLYTHT